LYFYHHDFSLQLQIGPWKLTQNIIQQEGVLGLFRGLGTTIAREMPGYFFFFGGYEATRGLLTPAGKTKDEIGTELCILE
jgi:solute carrier family 25 ornithine transporter 2/15